MIQLSEMIDAESMLALRMAIYNRIDRISRLYEGKPVQLAREMGHVEHLCNEIGEEHWFEGSKGDIQR